MHMRHFWLGALVTALSVGGALAAGFAIDPPGDVRAASDGITTGAFTSPPGR
jgi:hypothetical protein